MKIRQAKKILKRFETGHPYRMDTRNRASYAWRGKRWCPSPLVGILAVLRQLRRMQDVARRNSVPYAVLRTIAVRNCGRPAQR